MSGSVLRTPLREAYRRARELDPESQLRECVDQLQHPEVIAAELRDSHALVARHLVECARAGPRTRGTVTGSPEAPGHTAFYASRDVSVIRDPSSFTCLASALDPLCDGSDGGLGAAREGLDYVGVTCTNPPQPVLGAVQSGRDGGAYPLLLRLLACLCELSHAAQIARLEALCFDGLLGAAPRFDLHIVVWDHRLNEDSVASERTPLNQLTHDLAERVGAALREGSQAPLMLGDILCLHMNPARFQGRLHFDWRV